MLWVSKESKLPDLISCLGETYVQARRRCCAPHNAERRKKHEFWLANVRRSWRTNMNRESERKPRESTKRRDFLVSSYICVKALCKNRSAAVRFKTNTWRTKTDRFCQTSGASEVRLKSACPNLSGASYWKETIRWSATMFRWDQCARMRAFLCIWRRRPDKKRRFKMPGVRSFSSTGKKRALNLSNVSWWQRGTWWSVFMFMWDPCAASEAVLCASSRRENSQRQVMSAELPKISEYG